MCDNTPQTIKAGAAVPGMTFNGTKTVLQFQGQPMRPISLHHPVCIGKTFVGGTNCPEKLPLPL
jgi:hypothetical protein